MTDTLRRAVELLERIRDTYLKNHQTERATIDEVVRQAREETGTGKPEPAPEANEPFEPLNVKKRKGKK